MNDKKLNYKDLLAKLNGALTKFRRFSLLAFLIFVGLVYGFLVLRINSLSGQEPTDSAVSSQVKAAKVPRIDPKVVQQLKSLQDNSVSVQALFDEARNNPFQ
jgi:hypothetical protein